MGAEPAGETTTAYWICGRCCLPYKSQPVQPPGCKCPTPVAAMYPRYETVLHRAPRRKLRPAGEMDQMLAQFAQRGKRVTVTLTGTVYGATVRDGEELTLFIKTDDHRSIIVRPSVGDRIAEPGSAP